MQDVPVFDVSIEATIWPMDSVVFLVEVISMLHIALCQEAKMALALDAGWKHPLYHPLQHGIMFDPHNGLAPANHVGKSMLVLLAEFGLTKAQDKSSL